jgi:hypothetical protein
MSDRRHDALWIIIRKEVDGNGCGLIWGSISDFEALPRNMVGMTEENQNNPESGQEAWGNFKLLESLIGVQLFWQPFSIYITDATAVYITF